MKIGGCFKDADGGRHRSPRYTFRCNFRFSIQHCLKLFWQILKVYFHGLYGCFMKRHVEAELARLKAARELHAGLIREIDLELGRVSVEAIAEDEYTRKTSIARVIGVSHTQVANLISAYERSDMAAPPLAGIPILENDLAGQYVLDRETRIVRSISGFSTGDVLARSNLDPRLFDADGRNYPSVPEMIWQLESGEWIGVGTVSVGYGGAGPRYAKQALVRAGVDEELAARIVSFRFCDAVDVSDPTTWDERTVWPAEPRSTPALLEDRIIVHIGERLNTLLDSHPGPARVGPAIDETGIEASNDGISEFDAWISFLDSPDVPDWARGPRVARIFLTELEAETQGFILKANHWGISRGSRSSPVVVIEQGFVQIWGHFYRPQNRTQLLPPEAYQVLAAASVYPEELAERDSRAENPLGRFFADLFGTSKPLPPSIDISEDGTRRLAFTPGLDAEQ